MAGAGYKLFNTGDVLTAAQVNTFLMEQTVMVFNDATARTAALSGVVAEGMLSYLKSTKQVEVYNGTAWVASDDPNAIQNTIVDAKGDLITATAADVPARLAVGNNGETLVADSSTSTGLRWQGSQAAGRNLTLNGSFDVWQRGTSFTPTTAVYSADRWLVGRGFAVTGSTYSRQLTNDTTNLPFIQYSLRAQRDSGNTSTQALFVSQSFETVNSIPYAGRTVTLSFYARAGANYSATSSSLGYSLQSGTGTDQNFLTTAPTGLANVINTTATLTTTWQRFQATATVGATATQLGLIFTFNPTGTAGTNDWFEVTGVQIEIGSIATTFSRAGGTLAGELAACQRYLPVISAGSEVYGYCFATNTYVFNLPFPTTSRVEPTGITLSTTAGNYTVYNQTNTQYSPSSIVFNTSSGVNYGSIVVTATGTAGNVGRLRLANSIGAILFTGCEL